MFHCKRVCGFLMVIMDLCETDVYLKLISKHIRQSTASLGVCPIVRHIHVIVTASGWLTDSLLKQLKS